MNISITISAVALVISIANYFGTQRFTLWKERKQELMKLFIKILMDIQSFKIAFLEHVEASHERFYTVSLLPKDGPPDVIKQAISDAEPTRQRERLTKQALHEVAAHLSADCTALGLIIDKGGDQLGRTIETYYSVVNTMGSVVKSAEKWEIDYLNPGIIAIRKEMKPIWNRFGKWSEYPDVT